MKNQSSIGPAQAQEAKLVSGPKSYLEVAGRPARCPFMSFEKAKTHLDEIRPTAPCFSQKMGFYKKMGESKEDSVLDSDFDTGTHVK